MRTKTTNYPSSTELAEKDGIISFTVDSNGKTWKDWLSQFRGKIEQKTEEALCLWGFKTTSGVTTKIVIIKRKFSPESLLSHDHLVEAYSFLSEKEKELRLKRATTEEVCLIREKFSDKDLKAMGLDWLMVENRGVKNAYGERLFLSLYNEEWLDSCLHCDLLCENLGYSGGFAYVVSRRKKIKA